jgi:hypothetical protein
MNSMPGFGGQLRSDNAPQFVPADFKLHLIKLIPERIVHSNGNWVVKPSRGNHILGTHPTKKAALKQLAAIEISKHRKHRK